MLHPSLFVLFCVTWICVLLGEFIFYYKLFGKSDLCLTCEREHQCSMWSRQIRLAGPWKRPIAVLSQCPYSTSGSKGNSSSLCSRSFLFFLRLRHFFVFSFFFFFFARYFSHIIVILLFFQVRPLLFSLFLLL